MKRTLQALGSIVAIQIGFFGCSSSTGVDDGEGGASGTTGVAQGTGATSKAAAGSTAATKAATQAAAQTNAASGTAASGGDCAMQATYEACDECFCTANEAGCDAYYEYEAEACICGANAPCAAACANACTNDVDDPACDTCLEGLSDDDACWTATEAACAADAGCQAYLDATEACEELPD